MNEEIIVRAAVLEDAPGLLEIYAPYVRKTVITFEYEVPSLEEFQNRMRKTLSRYPYLVAERNGELLGYVYTGPFIGRAAYQWGAELSVYLREDCRRQGIGKRLYQTVEEISRMQNFLNLNACIGYPEKEDSYLTKNSAEFHAHLGYQMVGKFHQCGYKFGRWYHMIWMEKLLGEHTADPAPVIPFPELKKEDLKKAGITVF